MTQPLIANNAMLIAELVQTLQIAKYVSVNKEYWLKIVNAETDSMMYREKMTAEAFMML